MSINLRQSNRLPLISSDNHPGDISLPDCTEHFLHQQLDAKIVGRKQSFSKPAPKQVFVWSAATMSSSENEVYSSLGGSSTFLDEVPFQISQKFQIVVLEEFHPMSPLSYLPLSDHSEVLTQTQYDFTLEKKILEWLRDCSLREPPRLIPTCPPFRLAFSDMDGEDTDYMNRDSHHAKAQTDHMILQTKRFRSFSVTDIKYIRSRVVCKSDTESDDGYSEDDELSSSDDNEQQKLPCVPLLRGKFNLHSRLLDGRPASSPFCSDIPSRNWHCERCLSASLTRLPHISGRRSSPLCHSPAREEDVRKQGSNWSQGHTPRNLCRKSLSQHLNNRNNKNLNSERISIGNPPLSCARCHLERSFMIRSRTPPRKHRPPLPNQDCAASLEANILLLPMASTFMLRSRKQTDEHKYFKLMTSNNLSISSSEYHWTQSLTEGQQS
ncbi:uncharacterized protein [Scyliorhinus torazame]|uniref:uncharacterized protein n=1 Tax=Scyliorhinus torazame TaxID=75743 RepID=UPI003B59CD3F